MTPFDFYDSLQCLYGTFYADVDLTRIREQFGNHYQQCNVIFERNLTYYLLVSTRRHLLPGETFHSEPF